MLDYSLDEVRASELQAEINHLLDEVQRLQEENHDLQIALLTVTEHGDAVEADLESANTRLLKEIQERQKIEASLRSIVEVISRQKQDMEIIIQILTEHGDSLDAQWCDQWQRANDMALTDTLTQIPNRRHFDNYIEQQWQTAIHQQTPLTVMIFDVDYFKQYNDYYGHGAGDDCLKILARLLQQTLPAALGLVARYGGEEFAAVLPNCPLDKALALAERWRSQIRQAQLPHRQSLIAKVVTLSIGVVTTFPRGDVSLRQVVDEADRLLYLAKHQGRDRICYALWPGSPACVVPTQ